MKKLVPFIVGAVMIVAGAVWTFQGLGYVKGSPMTDVAVWAIVGPIVAGLGVALIVVGLQARHRR